MRQQEIKGGTGVSEHCVFEKDLSFLEILNFLLLNFE